MFGVGLCGRRVEAKLKVGIGRVGGERWRGGC